MDTSSWPRPQTQKSQTQSSSKVMCKKSISCCLLVVVSCLVTGCQPSLDEAMPLITTGEHNSSYWCFSVLKFPWLWRVHSIHVCQSNFQLPLLLVITLLVVKTAIYTTPNLSVTCRDLLDERDIKSITSTMVGHQTRLLVSIGHGYLGLTDKLVEPIMSNRDRQENFVLLWATNR